ncbi:MFS transporter, partial [Alistipes shahii]
RSWSSTGSWAGWASASFRSSRRFTSPRCRRRADPAVAASAVERHPDGVLLAAFMCYVFCCAISVCAVVWVLLSEMYPIRVRGVAMSIAGFSLWTGTYLVGQLTPWMLANLTPAGTFFLFAAMCVPYMLLIWKAVPEMSGRTLEEIEQYWTR